MQRVKDGGDGDEMEPLRDSTTSGKPGKPIGLYIICYQRPAKWFPFESHETLEQLRAKVAREMQLSLDEVQLLDDNILLDDKTVISDLVRDAATKRNIRTVTIYEERLRQPETPPSATTRATTWSIILFMAVPLLLCTLLGLVLFFIPSGVQNFLGNYTGVVGMLITYAWFGVFVWHSFKTGTVKYSFRPN
jgi:hypothetical protein